MSSSIETVLAYVIFLLFFLFNIDSCLPFDVDALYSSIHFAIVPKRLGLIVNEVSGFPMSYIVMCESDFGS